MKKLLTILLLTLSSIMYSQQMTRDEVYDCIMYYEIQHPDIVYTQYALESGWGKSKAARVRNNIFGFLNGQKYFDSWEDCIKFYKLWQDKNYKGGDYYEFLKRIRYASSPTYVSTLKRIKR